MFCDNGHPVAPGARFCMTCGRPVASAVASPTFASTVRPMPSPMYAPATGYAAVGVATTSGFAIASLVLGILGGAILAIIFGFVALSQIKKSGAKGRGMAIAGVVLGFVWSALFVILIIAAVIASSPSRYSGNGSYRDGYNWGYDNANNYSDCSWYRYGPSNDNSYDWEQGCHNGYWDN